MCDYEEEPPQEEDLKTNIILRLHADNLPRCGVRLALPDTYAVVTAVEGRSSRISGPLSVSNSHVMRKHEWGRTEM